MVENCYLKIYHTAASRMSPGGQNTDPAAFRLVSYKQPQSEKSSSYKIYKGALLLCAGKLKLETKLGSRFPLEAPDREPNKFPAPNLLM
jgi:hypothetical protein